MQLLQSISARQHLMAFFWYAMIESRSDLLPALQLASNSSTAKTTSAKHWHNCLGVIEYENIDGDVPAVHVPKGENSCDIFALEGGDKKLSPDPVAGEVVGSIVEKKGKGENVGSVRASPS